MRDAHHRRSGRRPARRGGHRRARGPAPAAPTARATAGATTPFTSVEAETALTDGTRIGPDHTQGTLASEASGRRAVRLSAGQSVEFTPPEAANALNVAYSVPDGGGNPDPDPGRNLAKGRPATATGHAAVYAPGRAVDGDPASYWESTNHASRSRSRSTSARRRPCAGSS